MRSLALLVLIAILASGCAGVGSVASLARYDLGPSVPPSGQPAILLLRSVEVSSPSWLASPAMQYRLAYAPESRREAYSQSRWVAPPAELLEGFLKRRMLADAASIQASGCRLRIELGEFVQAFDTPDASHAMLEISAALLAPHGDLLLSRRAFKQSQPAGADARAGAAAFAAASAALADELDAWLAEIARKTPELVPRCRGS